ncbi:MAG: alpha/beta fold hydrolase [Planctomycetota bacterium]
MTFLYIAATALLVGFLFEAVARRWDRKRWPRPGRRVDVGGHGLHTRVFGDGERVIVFEADEGAWSTHWGRLPEELGKVATSVVYDRAGLGWSESGPPPRDVETLARELHHLLQQLAPGRPVILVGHGTGAGVVRTYAHRYPFETSALVLVDPMHEGFGDLLRREQVSPLKPSALGMGLASLLGRFGVLRLVHARQSPNEHLPLPAPLRAELDAHELAPGIRRAAAAEMESEAQNVQYLAGLPSVSELPIRALISTATLPASEAPADYPHGTYNRLWTEQSAAFLELSKRAQRVIVEGSSHQLQLERPEIVLEAILEAIGEVEQIEALRAAEDS